MHQQPLRVLVVDDEPLARARLIALLDARADVVVVGQAADSASAVAHCQVHAPDVVLLDIAMPGSDGFAVARDLARIPAPPAVIFCTAFDEHALSAFDVQAIDYLVKPVRGERLAAALDKARLFLAGRRAADRDATAPARRQLSARLGGNLRLIAVSDILYLQADEKYVVVHHARGQDLIEEPLRALEAEFAGRFLRIHRNCLVARDHLLELRRTPDGRTHAVLRGVDAPLEVSRRCLPPLREALAGG